MRRQLTDNRLQCSECKEFKKLSEFYTYKDSRTGKEYYRSNCKECCKNRGSSYTSSLRGTEKLRLREQARHLRRRYGLTVDQFIAIYESLFEKQGGRCAICGTDVPSRYRGKNDKERRFNLDHCHKTQKIRGLLCGQCNTGLGMFGDNIEWLRSAIKYLQEDKI